MSQFAIAWAFVGLTAAGLCSQQRSEGDRTEERQTVEIVGTLLDDAFQPVGGVPLTVVASDERDYRAAIKATPHRSDARGRVHLRLARDPKMDAYLLIGGRRFATHRLRLPRSGRKDLGALALARGCSATGRVRTADGKPPQDADVQGSDLLDSRTFLRNARYGQVANCATRTVVDARGIFVLSGMVRSAGTITISCPGYEDAVLEPVAIGSPLDVTLRPARRVRGTVVDEAGKPVAGATVSAGISSAKTDTDGRFEMFLRRPHERQLRCFRRTDDALLRADNIEIRDAGKALAIEVTEVPFERVVVRAQDADGNPVQEFTAFLVGNRRDQLRFRHDTMLIAQAMQNDGQSAHTANGELTLRYRARGSDDTVLLFARAPGHGWGRLQVPREDARRAPQVVQMAQAGKIGGLVKNADTGAPLPGVTIVATAHLDAQVRHHFESGLQSPGDLTNTPNACTSAADGTWQIADTPPGKLHLLVCMGERIVLPIQTIELEPGEQKLDIEFVTPPLRTLQGRMRAPRADGLQVWPHWHRSGVSSPGWATHYDGAADIDDDGSFRLVDLPPLQYRLQTILPTPPRGGLRLKVDGPLWDARKPTEERFELAPPEIVYATGRVAGEVPWSRLALLAYPNNPNTFIWQFAPPGVVAPLAGDRAYRLQLPKRQFRLMLFDVLTGVVLEFRDIDEEDLRKPLEWSCRAVQFDVHLHDLVENTHQPVAVHYIPTEDNSPVKAHRGLRGNPSSGMQTEARAGDTLHLYLPDRSGTLRFVSGSSQLEVDVATLPKLACAVDVGPEQVRLRSQRGALR